MARIERGIRPMVNQGEGDARQLGIPRILRRAKPLVVGLGSIAALGYLSLSEIKGHNKDFRQKEFDKLVKQLKATGYTNMPLNPHEAQRWVDNFYAIQSSQGYDSLTPKQLAILTEISSLTGSADITVKDHDRADGKQRRKKRGIRR